MLVMKNEEMASWIGKRKHSSQMTEFEVKELFSRLKSVEENGDKWRMAGHTLDRIQQKGINVDYWDIVSSVWHSEMIEYKIDKNKFTGEPEERVVIRSKAIANKKYNLHAVFSLTERRIVTVWLNHINDRHDTLDWSIYNKKMPVFGI